MLLLLVWLRLLFTVEAGHAERVRRFTYSFIVCMFVLYLRLQPRVQCREEEEEEEVS